MLLAVMANASIETRVKLARFVWGIGAAAMRRNGLTKKMTTSQRRAAASYRASHPRQECRVVDCETLAVGHGVCWVHLDDKYKTRCSVEGCDTFAHGHGVCWVHLDD